MYTRQKPYGVENYNSKNMPSFSSTLLDEIYRSIDENPEETEAFWPYREKSAKRQGTIGKNPTKDEEMESFRRSYMVHKWMENGVTCDKVVSKRSSALLHDNDSLFFGSTSSSSDSSGQLSSSENEFFGSTKKPQVSCSAYTRPKPIRTVVVSRENGPKEDYKNHDKMKFGDDMIKSKSRALKIYANLKKVKQPISPGGRLTSLINYLFSNASGKKAEKHDMKSSKSVSSSTCSSASSFSRSCLSKYSPESREKMRNGIKRTVRFHPVSVIVGEDSRPCGRKFIYNDDSDRYRTRSIPTKNRAFQENEGNFVKGYCHTRKVRDESDEDEEEDDAMSDTSSNLFELDHMEFFGNNRFCEELPVYETTTFDRNRVIASGLIR